MDVIRSLNSITVGHMITADDVKVIKIAAASVGKDIPLKMSNGVCPACGQRRIDSKHCPYCGQALVEEEGDPDEWMRYTD